MDCRLQVWPVVGVLSVSNARDEQWGHTWPIIGVSAQDDLHTEDENEVCPGPSGPAAAPIRTFWRQPIPSRRELGVRSCR